MDATICTQNLIQLSSVFGIFFCEFNLFFLEHKKKLKSDEKFIYYSVN